VCNKVIDERSDLTIVPDSLFNCGSSRHEGGRVLRENCCEAGEETLLQVALLDRVFGSHEDILQYATAYL
jgi:hypothetical protein